MQGRLVRLRGYEKSDLAAVMKWVTDEEVTRQLGAGALTFPVSSITEEQFIEAATHAATDPNNKVFAIETIAESRYIGAVDLRGINWIDRHAEVGIVIGDKSLWGKGYGTDAMRVIMRLGFAKLGLNRLWLKVFDFNHRAIKSYEKCGFKHEGVLRGDHFAEGRYHDTIVMGILESEYREASKAW